MWLPIDSLSFLLMISSFFFLSKAKNFLLIWKMFKTIEHHIPPYQVSSIAYFEKRFINKQNYAVCLPRIVSVLSWRVDLFMIFSWANLGFAPILTLQPLLRPQTQWSTKKLSRSNWHEAPRYFLKISRKLIKILKAAHKRFAYERLLVI